MAGRAQAVNRAWQPNRLIYLQYTISLANILSCTLAIATSYRIEYLVAMTNGHNPWHVGVMLTLALGGGSDPVYKFQEKYPIDTRCMSEI